MKLITTGLFFLMASHLVLAQTYEGLQKMDGVKQEVYFSKDAKIRASEIFDHVAKAEIYLENKLNVHPNYKLLVLSPSDWKKYAHPNAIYGMPHYLPDGRLVVASENNDFWRRNIPPLDRLPEALAKRLKSTYADKNGEVVLTDFFDLLAIHELGHAFQKAAGMVKQRNWLNELLCNILLHTFIAEKEPKLLSSLTIFPQVTVAGFPADRLKYTKLDDFETYYNEIAQKYPDNYGWYQCRFHTAAGQIYDAGGTTAMEKLWKALLTPKEKLADDQLKNLLNEAHPAMQQAILNWDK